VRKDVLLRSKLSGTRVDVRRRAGAPLRNVKMARRRRRARPPARALEATDEADLREALRLILDFERVYLSLLLAFERLL
jgi:hypothetical protein